MFQQRSTVSPEVNKVEYTAGRRPGGGRVILCPASVVRPVIYDGEFILCAPAASVLALEARDCS
ncbi:hypothetical protein M569_11152 [Genlisea aurea]|uniref:Uncharacterized protein n=1 Tax=Genlisea aurea TaxID=192259 RepID=S8DUP5_9LAMI|nr:hypothetical protein M569_11152 [Genlisea aurea]